MFRAEDYGFAFSEAQDWFWATTVCFGLAFILTTLLLALDRRRIAGESVWLKPLKFALSLFIHFLTLALLTGGVSKELHQSGFLTATAIAACAAAAFEIVYIGFRAARQERSHFNVGTPVARLMYALMALGAIVLTLAAGILGGYIFFDPDFAGGAGLRWGSVLGLCLGTLMTLITAFAMGGALSHHVGQEAAGAPKMPVTGWSFTVGDRRPAHFVATHVMQVLPVAGLIFDQALPPPVATALVALLAGLSVLLTIWLFHQASQGRPFFRVRHR
ncbi:hypothetical protein [Asticcacaulis sp. AND118]|uniref:hypothetical protein n=1 Tax=Asticcacaulis sp. AND118 TaxID=2840468 RepID=UPI001CFFFC73|nr:hypothetical protein [Asticcacaulis sp. AND118]UDF05606.1 hypothetical protein LH365_15570 [Asticcacaulis sp. AND118]